MREPSEGSKRAEEPRNELSARLFRQARDPVFEIADIVVRLLIRIDRIHCDLHRVKQAERRHIGTHQNLRVHAHGHGVRHKRFGQDRLGQPIIQFVGDDANDSHTVFGTRARSADKAAVA